MIRTTQFSYVIIVMGVLNTFYGCDDGAKQEADGAPLIDAMVATTDATPPECFPNGTYGICAEVGCPMCLKGAGIYEVCTSACERNSDCGDAADVEGAMPLCAPLNPGAMQKICVLTCTSTEQCPCGLECRPSGAGPKICAQTL